jgi:hypothetical protein
VRAKTSFLERVAYAAIAGGVATAAALIVGCCWVLAKPEDGGWFHFSPLASIVFLSVAAAVCDLVALVIALPLIYLARDVSGWRMVLWGVLGTLYLPALEAGFLTQIHPSEPVFSVETAPILLGFGTASLLATCVYILLVRRADRSPDEPANGAS